MGAGTFPPYLFAYAETLKAEPAVTALRELAAQAGARLWITGGTLRDVLLTRWPNDLDLAVEGDTSTLGRQLADAGHGTFVPLDPDTGTVRVALNGTQGIDWIDMVALRAPTIEADLTLRDFTINAIALPLDDQFDASTAPYIDPTGGRDDLHRRILRITGKHALEDDPIRVLRGYRIAARLGFEMDAPTRRAMISHADQTSLPAAERTAHELASLLATPDPSTTLAEMMADGVLPVLIPELHDTVGVGQNGYHHLDVWGHTLETVRIMAELIANPGSRPIEDFDAYLRTDAARQVLLWAALLHDVGKPPCRTEQDGRVRFYGHEDRGAEMADCIGLRLRHSNRHRLRVTRLVKNHLRPLLLASKHNREPVTVRAVDRLYRALEEDLPGLFLLALADTRATRGVDAEADSEARLLALWHHVNRCRAESITPVDDGPPLLTGHDLIHRFGLSEGPLIGHILADFRDARIAGELDDAPDNHHAIEHWLKTRLKTRSQPSEKD